MTMTAEEIRMWKRLGQPPEEEKTMTPQAQAAVAVTTARERLTHAQQELDRTQAEADQERRAQLITQLAQVRQELRTARTRHQELVQRIHTEREARDNAQAKVAQVLVQLGDSERARPAAADYLPDDQEVVQWRKAHEALETKRDRLIAERGKLADPDRTVVEANKYEGAMGSITTLTFAEQNLIRALEGRGGIVRIEGGVFGVR